MKAFVRGLAFLVAAIAVSTITVAQESTATGSPASFTARVVADANIPVLAPGVADIVKMAQAKIGDSVILAYIENSGTVYNLDANQIVFLRDTGVSEPVLSAMLNQRTRYIELAATKASQSSPEPSAYGTTPYTQPQPAYVQPEPAQAAASSVYVIPYQTGLPNYGYYNYFPIYPLFYGGFGFSGFHPHRFDFHSGFPHRSGVQHNSHSSFRGQSHSRR
jgi:hypothetical protein